MPTVTDVSEGMTRSEGIETFVGYETSPIDKISEGMTRSEGIETSRQSGWRDAFGCDPKE